MNYKEQVLITSIKTNMQYQKKRVGNPVIEVTDPPVDLELAYMTM